MTTKLFEVRDRATFIACFATDVTPGRGETHLEHYLLRRAGYGPESSCILFGRLEGGRCFYDPYDWGQSVRTMIVAHQYIAKNFDTLESGSVVDVEFILKETEEAKKSERLEHAI